MDTSLKEILDKLNEINSRLDSLERDMAEVKLEVQTNNVTINAIQKISEDMDDRILNIYDDIGKVGIRMKNTDAKIDILASMIFPSDKL